MPLKPYTQASPDPLDQETDYAIPLFDPSLVKASEEIRFQIVVFAVVTVISMIFLAFPLRWIWNHMLPAVVDVSEISYWEAMGLVGMSRMIQAWKYIEFFLEAMVSAVPAAWMPERGWNRFLLPGLLTALDSVGLLQFLRLFQESARKRLLKYLKGGDKRQRREDEWADFYDELTHWAKGGRLAHKR
jgi:hypothetical protein